MDKLETYAGGHRLTTSQLMFLQTATREALSALCTMFGNNFIVSGCEITDGIVGGIRTVSITAGWVCVDGEICEVEAQSVSSAIAGTVFFDITETAGAPQVIFYDTTARDVYKLRKATIHYQIGFGSLPGDIFSLPRTQFAWTEVTPAVNVDFSGIADATTRLSYKLINGEVILRGRIRKNGPLDIGGSILVCTLPAGFRPKFSIAQKLPFRTDATFTIDYTNGQCTISDALDSTPTTYTIPDIRFRID